jgi:hypothetical protein
MKHISETEAEAKLLKEYDPIATVFIKEGDKQLSASVTQDVNFSEYLAKISKDEGIETAMKCISYFGGTFLTTMVFELKRLNPSTNIEQCFAIIQESISERLDELEKTHLFEDSNDAEQ